MEAVCVTLSKTARRISHTPITAGQVCALQ